MRTFLFVGFFLATALAQPARADGLIYKLPDDGAQVRYDLEIAITGQDAKVNGSLSVSSVGKTTENGEDCRWIEFKMILNSEGQDHVVISKVLVPEKHLGKGKSGVENVIRGWIKDDNGEPFEIKDLKAPQAVALRA